MVSFRNRVAGTSPNDDIPVSVIREGKELDLTVVIGRLSSAKTATVSTEENKIEPLGLTLNPLNDAYREQYGYSKEKGVVVAGVEPGSKAAKAGFRTGMLIKAVNRHSVETLDEVHQRLETDTDAESLLFLVRDGANTRYIAVDLAD